MSLIYRALGVFARMGERLSRFRVNFIPINLLVMVLLGILGALAAREARDALVNGETPRVVSVSDVLDHRDTEHNFMTVRGVLIPHALATMTRKEKYSQEGTVEKSYLPLVDLSGQRALLVAREGDYSGSEPSPNDLKNLGVSEVTGMLIPLESDLKEQLSEGENATDGVKVDTEYMLVEGQRPGSVLPSVAGTVVFCLLLLLMFMTFLNKYVVFEKTGHPLASLRPPPGDEEPDEIDLRATGHFALSDDVAQRFLNVPASLGWTEGGDIVVGSNIDASSSMYGVKTEDRAGMWVIVMQKNSLRNVELGNLYDGFAVRPALRFGYVSGFTNRSESAILSFRTKEEREVVLNDLQTDVASAAA